MGILGVDELSGDAPLMEAGLDSLCLGCGMVMLWLVVWLRLWMINGLLDAVALLVVWLVVCLMMMMMVNCFVDENWSHDETLRFGWRSQLVPCLYR